MQKTAAIGLIAAVVLAGLGATRGDAADTNRRFGVRGLGTKSCSEYLETRDLNAKEAVAYAHWLTGFFTAYNWLQPDTYDIAPPSEYQQAGLLIYLDRYCGQHPTERIIEAAMTFTRVVYEKRVRVGS